MQRLNLTIDEKLYEQARVFSFLEKKSISQIIRESLSEYINNSGMNKKANLILEADDEQEILAILANDDFISHNELKSKLNL
jgi:hypothetical protein